ncbi:hypothetical protein [Phocaeicola coprophilus]|jgi:hypothetical protein|uniref:hypothetical protein n=1 Tax=Phocaeicola coprophilus TaxID=387090 RepID=UPI00241F5582|nr:hypothetical protein [Phocaeicola coprophilus]
METCQKLQETLEQFTPANSIDKLTIQFENIAQVVFNGRFVVNGEYEIYPIEIEFYYHDEEKGTIIEPQMYHIKELPYFPIGSLCPNRSGVDMTFEREGKYRASFLIRGYTYKSLVDGEVYTNRDISKKAIVFKPQYLWEDLFGNATLFKQGLSIIWVDNDEFNKVRIKSSARINVHKIEGEETDRMWRFTNLDAMI